MSGNATQRGKPALCDKYARAQVAVMSGADLVLEIPFPQSSSCAEIFAASGVGIASKLGVVDALVFGSESGNIDYLKSVSRNLTSSDFDASLRYALEQDKKTPFLYTKSRVYYEMFGKTIPSSPNDILATEYISALNCFSSNILPITYKRVSEYSAGASREMIERGDYSYIPSSAEKIIKNASKCNYDLFGELILSFVRTHKRDYYEGIFDLPSDLADSICACAEKCRDYTDFIKALSRGGYTEARISRCLIYSYCDIRYISKIPTYTRLLAANSKGREILSNSKKVRTIEIITKPADYLKLCTESQNAFRYSMAFDALYSQVLFNKQAPSDMMKKMPFILD